MDHLYAVLVGPVLWITLAVFVVGIIFRVAFLFGLSRERDRVFYNHMDWSWGLRSIGHWLMPWGSASMRNQPIFSAVFFIFHLCLFGIPLFLLAHNTLLVQSLGWSLPSMPDAWADTLTLVMIASVIFLFVRRLVRPEVKILTSAWDYCLLVLTLLPFITGFLAYHQWAAQYQTWLILHIICSEILLVIIPFTKLAHIILFFFSRAFIGFEMGTRRGATPW